MVEINFSHAESLFLHETLEASNVSCRKRGEKRERESVDKRGIQIDKRGIQIENSK